MSPGRRLLLLIATVALLAAATAWLPSSLPDDVARLGAWGPVAAVAAGTALLIALVPRTPISLACGVLFGAAIGALCAIAVALCAATATFIAGRLLGQEFVARRTGRWWAGWRGWVEREGMLAVAAVRSLPLGPYGLTGYVYGASPVRTRDYAAGTIMAATPSAITYSFIGAALAGPGEVTVLTAVPPAFALVFSAVLVYRARRAHRAARSHLQGGETPSSGRVVT